MVKKLGPIGGGLALEIFFHENAHFTGLTQWHVDEVDRP
jgi:hypothetical protein